MYLKETFFCFRTLNWFGFTQFMNEPLHKLNNTDVLMTCFHKFWIYEFFHEFSNQGKLLKGIDIWLGAAKLKRVLLTRVGRVPYFWLSSFDNSFSFLFSLFQLLKNNIGHTYMHVLFRKKMRKLHIKNNLNHFVSS